MKKEFQKSVIYDYQSGRQDTELNSGTITTTAIVATTINATTVNATTLDTNNAAAGVTLKGTTLAADGTDANIDITITPKGATGVVTSVADFDIDGGTIDDTVIDVGVQTIQATDMTATGTITDGTLTAVGGVVSTAGSITATTFTDGTASISGGVISGATSVSSTTLTDGTATITGGDLTDIGTIVTTDNIGTPGTDVTAVEYGNGKDHVSVLTVTSKDISGGRITAAGNLRVGGLLYTFPAGAHLHHVTYSSIALQGDLAVHGDTPDCGIGSTVGTMGAATLNGTTEEDYITGYAATDCNSGGPDVNYTAATAGYGTGISVNGAADAKTVYLNAAAAWSGATAALEATGTVVLKWTSIA